MRAGSAKIGAMKSPPSDWDTFFTSLKREEGIGKRVKLEFDARPTNHQLHQAIVGLGIHAYRFISYTDNGLNYLIEEYDYRGMIDEWKAKQGKETGHETARAKRNK